MRDIVASTGSYEAWKGRLIPLVAADLERKHARMAASPFVFLRATHYRFCELRPELLADLESAPTVPAVGDIHVENLGSWRDRAGRLAWGVNDLDEAELLPFAADLVRLAASAVLAIEEAHLGLSAEHACTAILAGWRSAIGNGGSPTLLAEHARLRSLVEAVTPTQRHFDERMGALHDPAALPAPARSLLDSVAPEPGWRYTLRHRVAGVGSLGHVRVCALGPAAGELAVREVKQLAPPASVWLGRADSSAAAFAQIAQAPRAGDRFLRRASGFVARRLAHDAVRIELTQLPADRDEQALLRHAGHEVANVHLGDPRAAASAQQFENGLERDWLHAAARVMARALQSDQAAWREHVRLTIRHTPPG